MTGISSHCLHQTNWETIQKLGDKPNLKSLHRSPFSGELHEGILGKIFHVINKIIHLFCQNHARGGKARAIFEALKYRVELFPDDPHTKKVAHQVFNYLLETQRPTLRSQFYEWWTTSPFSNSKEVDRVRDMKEQTSPQTLPDGVELLRDYLRGEHGEHHTLDHPLRFDGYELWGMSFGGDLDINIQHQEEHLNFQLAKGERLMAVFFDAQPISIDEFGNEDHPAHQLLQRFINYFLATHGILEQDHSRDLFVHRKVLERLPETVLTRIEPGQKYKFLDQEFNFEPAVDAGGPEQEFILGLAMNLFTKSPRIQLINNLPAVKNEKDHHLLEDFGEKLLGRVFTNPILTMGRIFDDRFFAALSFFVQNPDLSQTNRMQAAKRLSQEKELEPLFDAYSGKISFKNPSIAKLADELWEDKPDSPESAKAFAMNIILDPVRYGRAVDAAYYMARGLLKSSMQWSDNDVTQLLSLDPAALSERIQGLTANPQEVIDRIDCSSSHPIVKQKAVWLKDFILSSTQKTVERLLWFVTSTTVLAADSKIHVVGNNKKFCTADTCFNTLAVPVTHSTYGTDATENTDNRVKFFKNLEFSLRHAAGFDMQ